MNDISITIPQRACNHKFPIPHCRNPLHLISLPGHEGKSYVMVTEDHRRIPVGFVGYDKTVTLFKAGMPVIKRGPLNARIAVMLLTTKVVVPEDYEHGRVVDMRTSDPVIPQTLEEAYAALDAIVEAAAEQYTTFHDLGDNLTNISRREHILHCMCTALEDPRIRRFNGTVDLASIAEPTAGEQAIIAHIMAGDHLNQDQDYDGYMYRDLIGHAEEVLCRIEAMADTPFECRGE